MVKWSRDYFRIYQQGKQARGVVSMLLAQAVTTRDKYVDVRVWNACPYQRQIYMTHCENAKWQLEQALSVLCIIRELNRIAEAQCYLTFPVIHSSQSYRAFLLLSKTLDNDCRFSLFSGVPPIYLVPWPCGRRWPSIVSKQAVDDNDMIAWWFSHSKFCITTTCSACFPIPSKATYLVVGSEFLLIQHEQQASENATPGTIACV